MRVFLILIISILLTGHAFGVELFDQVKSSYQPSDAVLLDRHGKVIHELRVDPERRRLEWTDLADISPAFPKMVLRSEDKRFYLHHGVDWQALASAAIGNMFGHTRRGASTITMQLAALLDSRLQPKHGPRSIRQKWEQIKAAREIEKRWTKDQILEAYLNLVSYRGELQGIAAASRGIFDKEPEGLDEAEAAILAALIRSPNASAERVGERARLLVSSLEIAVPPTRVSQLARERLSKSYSVRQRIVLAPHAARMLLHEGNRAVTSTLDSSVQRFVLETLQRTIGLLSDQNVLDGAALVVDNRTGDVLAYVGNVGSESSAAYVDGIQARRQAGSTLKPFLYGLAIEKKIITAASLIDDSPLNISTARGVYRPENYDKEFRGLVPARTALASSINIPAVRTLNLIGVDAFAAKLREFGFSGLRDSEYYGPSLALGTADVTLWELVNAYRTLANSGIRTRMRMKLQDKRGVRRRALSRGAAFIISSILSDREARSSTFSLESSLSTRFWAAVKTGTSKDMRDNWCVGYSDSYTVGVWVGNFSGAPMWNVSGISGAAPAWLEIMNYLHRRSTSKMPAVPDGVISRLVTIKDSQSSTRKLEFFIAGTEEDTIYADAVVINPKIVYPARDMVIAIDPDIPLDLQKIYFDISADDPTLRLKIDETILSMTPNISWKPSPGTHQVYLLDREGHIADHVSFDVR